jgi:hypothetical protein
MHRKPQPYAPRCPDHIAVQMVPLTPEIQRGYKFGKYAHLKKKVIKVLRSSPRWKCPVENCKRCEVFPVAG